MKLQLVILAAVVLGGTSVAHADTPPSVWDRAKDQEVADDFAIHEQAMARLHSLEDVAPESGFEAGPAASFHEAQLRGVIAMLQAAGAETSKRPLLRFDLALAYETFGEDARVASAYQRAAALYKSALADFPDYEAADDAWSGLAQACAHAADRDCEVRSWHEVLRRRTEDAARVTPTLNLAEVEMHNGDLKSAIEGYRESFALAARLPNGTEEAILAEYGLAVALDRVGEIGEADHAAKLAVDMAKGIQEPNILHSKNVYFVPAYEVNWYDALGWAAVARTTTNVKMRHECWVEATAAFTRYVEAGAIAKDRWLPIAKARLALYTAERDKAEKQVRAIRTPPPVLEWPAPPSGPAPQVHNPGGTILHL